MDVSRLRNLGIVAHIDAGKTTVSERILFDAGVEHRMGNVDEGTTVLDWMQEERERGITITAAATTIPWKDHRINLIDTPGHVDFTIEVERSLRVLDGAILVVDAVMGVQAQSETVWRQMQRHHVPCLAFVNKLDRPGADYLRAVGDLAKKLRAHAVPVQYPLWREGRLTGIVDLLTRRTWMFAGAGEQAIDAALDVPPDAADEVGVLRSELLDALADGDDEVLACVLERREPELPALERALRRRVVADGLVPVFCGIALRNQGIQPLLDAVVKYLPSPLDLPPVRGTDPRTHEPIDRKPSVEEPVCALAFKLQSQAHGELAFVRVYSGRITSGAHLWNPRAQKLERVGRLLRMHANHGEGLESAGPGEIVAISGLKHTSTGDTLCEREAPIVLEALEFPEPVISLVLEPANSPDRDKLRLALGRLAHEDPSFHVHEQPDTGQWTISGMGELHLEVLRHRLEHEFHVEVRVGTPRVAYREAVTAAARGRGRVERQLGGKEVFGDVEVELRPDPSLTTPAVGWEPDVGIPSAFRKVVEGTLALETHVGPRFGFPLSQVKIAVVGGSSDPRRDAEMGFAQAASQALREALSRSEVVVLEPLMRFEIESPAEFSSGILADLGSRKAEVREVSADGAVRSICGLVPLSQMFGYSTAVRSLSQGRAGFSMSPAGLRPVPESELAARGLVWT
ncbi:MAG: elongation factor G [Planctomycetota bacterium]